MLSVVIPTFNRAAMLARCIRSVATAIPQGAEIIASDDGSTDDTAATVEALRREGLPVRLVVGPNAGPAAARNRGWLAAAGDVIAFIDDDCVAEGHWGQAFLDALSASPQPAGVEGSTLPEFPAPSSFFHHSIQSQPGAHLTCNIAFHRDALEAVGGFDQRFLLAGCEDLDLCERIISACGPIAYASNAIARHAVVPIGPRYYLRRVRLDADAYRLFARHPDLFRRTCSMLRVPIPQPRKGSRPSFLQIALYLLAGRAHHAFFSLRDGRTLRERLLGLATHILCAALSLTGLARQFRAYREGVMSG
jgi:glycosyltransferase involved in cell wall biosynthesis